jgi:hypothetical protein
MAPANGDGAHRLGRMGTRRSDDEEARAVVAALRERRHSGSNESRWSPTAVASLALAEQPALSTAVPDLELVKGALLAFGGADREGQLVAAVGSAWLGILRLLERDPHPVMQMSPRTWEEFVAGCYDRDGYRVTLTPRSADLGRHVIAENPGIGTIRVLDQVKGIGGGSGRARARASRSHGPQGNVFEHPARSGTRQARSASCSSEVKPRSGSFYIERASMCERIGRDSRQRERPTSRYSASFSTSFAKGT